MDIRVKRAYRAARRSDGARVLVDRLWPRGLSKERFRFDHWAKEVAPSTELRHWFAHDPARWAEFRTRYADELDARPEEVKALLALAREGPVTLLYAAKDEELNNAVALKEYLERHAMREKP
jgi:uncharacterized protein YeaO (DUF488 family)